MLKVAVLDASAISRDLLKSVLTNGGFEVVGDANIGPAAIAAMAKLQPQIVCVDAGGAGADGMATLDALRAALPKALIFLISGKLDAEAVRQAMERGVQGFIVKPFNAATVLSTIRNAVVKLARQHRNAGGETRMQETDA